jgi:hypothetical protein
MLLSMLPGVVSFEPRSPIQTPPPLGPVPPCRRKRSPKDFLRHAMLLIADGPAARADEPQPELPSATRVSSA